MAGNLKGIWKLMALACMGLVAAASAFGQVPAPASLPQVKHRVAVIGHRGGAALGPENTLATYQKAIEMGLDYLEIDVRVTRDGQFVILHDSTLERTTSGKGKVSDLDLATIRGFDAGDGQKVPTLEETLDVCRDKINIYLDHKEGPIEALVGVIRAKGMEGHVVVYDGVEECKEWKRVAPGIPVMPGLPDEYDRPGGIADFLKIVRVEILDGGINEWHKDLVDQAHASGVQVYVDCLSIFDNNGVYEKALEIGVDGIQTDHPDKLLKFLDSSK